MELCCLPVETSALFYINVCVNYVSHVSFALFNHFFLKSLYKNFFKLEKKNHQNIECFYLFYFYFSQKCFPFFCFIYWQFFYFFFCTWLLFLLLFFFSFVCYFLFSTLFQPDSSYWQVRLLVCQFCFLYLKYSTAG